MFGSNETSYATWARKKLCSYSPLYQLAAINLTYRFLILVNLVILVSRNLGISAKRVLA